MINPDLFPLSLETTRLRPLATRDADAFAHGTDEPLIRRFAHLPCRDYTPESARRMTAEQAGPELERGQLAVLAIADTATDALLGSVVLFDVTDRSAEVGFWLAAHSRGRGHANRALALAVRLARGCGLSQLTARTVPENTASHRILARAGFTRVASGPGRAPSGERTELVTWHRSLTQDWPLRTERLSLRPFIADDAAWLRRVYGAPRVARYLLEEPWTEQMTQQKLAERMPRTDVHGPDGALALVIEHEGEPVGDVGLWLTDREHGIAEIGWVLDPAHAGRGFATEAVTAMLELGLAREGLHRVVAQMDARNTASAALARRVGMRHEAHFRRDWWSKGEWTDTLVFAALGQEWRTSGSAGPKS